MYGRNATYPTSTKESTMNFTDKITLVTGGASGIGRATVTKFAQLGATVIFTDINDVNGPAFEKELVEAGHKARFVKSDGTSYEDVNALIDLIVADHGRLDIAVNNVGNLAGGDAFGVPVHETTNDAFEGTLNVRDRKSFYAMKQDRKSTRLNSSH